MFESELFHDVGGVFHHTCRAGRLSGPDAARRSYASFASFSDPDGNGWLLLPQRTGNMAALAAAAKGEKKK